jgi:hypothetical protein
MNIYLYNVIGLDARQESQDTGTGRRPCTATEFPSVLPGPVNIKLGRPWMCFTIWLCTKLRNRPGTLDTGHRVCLTENTIWFTICLFISPDLDGHRAPKMEYCPRRDPQRGTPFHDHDMFHDMFHGMFHGMFLFPDLDGNQGTKNVSRYVSRYICLFISPDLFRYVSEHFGTLHFYCAKHQEFKTNVFHG